MLLGGCILVIKSKIKLKYDFFQGLMLWNVIEDYFQSYLCYNFSCFWGGSRISQNSKSDPRCRFCRCAFEILGLSQNRRKLFGHQLFLSHRWCLSCWFCCFLCFADFLGTLSHIYSRRASCCVRIAISKIRRRPWASEGSYSSTQINKEIPCYFFNLRLKYSSGQF